jgi:hypothetical protein
VKEQSAFLSLYAAKLKLFSPPARPEMEQSLPYESQSKIINVQGALIMMYENAHQPVILLLDGSTSGDNQFIKRWFQKSRFVTCEATDIFEALEDVSDFTTFQRPDVILLEVKSIPKDFYVVKKMIQTPAGETEMPIFAFSENGNLVNDESCFEGNLAQLEARLDRMIPVSGKNSRAIAA